MPEIFTEYLFVMPPTVYQVYVTARCIIMKISTKIRLAIKHDTRCIFRGLTDSRKYILMNMRNVQKTNVSHTKLCQRKQKSKVNLTEVIKSKLISKLCNNCLQCLLDNVTL